MKSNNKSVTVILLEDFLASGLSGALDLLNTANLVYQYMHRDSPALFSWNVVSLDGQPVKASNGYVHPVNGSIEQTPCTDVIYLPGVSLISERKLTHSIESSQALYPWLKKHYLDNSILVSSCTGSLFLAEAGLLHNKKATSSWMFAEFFKRRYPDVQLQSDDILTEQDSIITSGASSSFQNVIVHVIQKLAGKELSSLVSKYMLVDTGRTSQAAFKVDLPSTFDIEDELIVHALNWIRKNLHKTFSTEQLAEHLHVSYRTLIRRFQTALGINIKSYIQKQRIESAKRMIEMTQLSVEEIVYRVGYNDVSAFRKLFKKNTNMTPQSYRQKFSV